MSESRIPSNNIKKQKKAKADLELLKNIQRKAEKDSWPADILGHEKTPKKSTKHGIWSITKGT